MIKSPSMMKRLVSPFKWLWQRRRKFDILASLFLVVIASLFLLGGSQVVLDGAGDRARVFTRGIEFDFTEWVVDAFFQKARAAFLSSERFIPEEERRQLVLDYLQDIRHSQELERRIENVYADPDVDDAEAASAELRQEYDQLKQRLDQFQPAAEAILQNQVAEVVAEMGLTLGGQPIPPVLYRTTPLPMALIISPRDVIRQDADISLVPDLSMDEVTRLEDRVARELDVSTLVVNIGGIGTYPTMVYETSNLEWLSEVVAHEWIHNYLTQRPLGLSYLSSPELRTMNETTASIAGKEIGRVVIERFYPELLPPPAPSEPATAQPEEPEPAQPVFNFVKEMHTTRVNADQLLAAGKIAEAEAYMEQRRAFFWDHGYLIRKLNQAYFAFYGAYADQEGGGAAGTDPVGAAVRELRLRSASLEEFIDRIAWMHSFEQLESALQT
jgi:hypothetical protein